MASLATLKKDALMYLLGMMLGLFIFGEIEPAIHLFMQSGFMGDSLTLPDFFDVSAWVVAIIIVMVALGGFLGAEWLEKRNTK